VSKAHRQRSRKHALRASGGSSTHRAIRKAVYSRFSRAKLSHRERTVSDILRLGRKTWENMENTKTAAHGDENSFQRELREARKSVHDSLERSAALLDNPRH